MGIIGVDFHSGLATRFWKQLNFATTRSPPRFRFTLDKSEPAGMLLSALLYPSRTLAGMFSAAEYMNGERSSAETVARRLEREIRKRIAIEKWPNPKGGREDARWYYLAPMFLDGMATALDWCRQFEKEIGNDDGDKKGFHLHIQQPIRELEGGMEELGKRPEDLCEVPADMELGSPAVCLTGAGFTQLDASGGDNAFRSHSNSPEAIAAVVCSYPKSDAAHWKSVLRYGRDECLQAVIDGLLFQIGEKENRGNDAVERIEKAAGISDDILQDGHFRGLETMERRRADEEWMSLRPHFAEAFAEENGYEIKGVKRRKRLRTAFNSPFRPFVLVSASIGQEGLVFHRYCRKVFHWNLPRNPIGGTRPMDTNDGGGENDDETTKRDVEPGRARAKRGGKKRWKGGGKGSRIRGEVNGGQGVGTWRMNAEMRGGGDLRRRWRLAGWSWGCGSRGSRFGWTRGWPCPSPSSRLGRRFGKGFPEPAIRTYSSRCSWWYRGDGQRSSGDPNGDCGR